MLRLETIQVLRWPESKQMLAKCSLEELMCWYAGQEPRYMVFLGQDPEFKKFWKRHYLRPLHIKRLMYKIKRFLSI